MPQPLQPESGSASGEWVNDEPSLSFICRYGHSVYRSSMSIKGEQQACLTALRIRLQAVESAYDHSTAPS